jgi:cell division transport system permease protein
MKASSFIYFLREGFRNLWANRLMSIASIGVLMACLILMGNTILLSVNINTVVKKIENTNEVLIYLNDGLNDKQISDIGKQIKANKNISECIYISKEQALKDYKARLGENADLLAGLEQDNPLPNAYKVKLNDLSKIQTTVSQMKKITGVLKVTNNNEFAQKLVNLRSTISIGIVWVVALMFLVSLFIIVNTIKIALYIRKREINIMKYVGATNWFIRWPFVFEGLFIGIIAGVVSFFLQWLMYHYVMSNIVGLMGNLKPILFGQLAGSIFLGFVGAGILVGACGSLISIRKYLKV